MIPLSKIREMLRNHEAVCLDSKFEKRKSAAVALIFAGPPAEPVLCFIRRAARSGDHWSGQMAFPGGRAESCDADPRAVAERETREEVGLELRDAEYLGRLSELWVRRAGVVTTEVLSPFAYYYAGDPPCLQCNHEVAEAYWIPVRHIWQPDNATLFTFERGQRTIRLPGIQYDAQVIWGLTHMMLESLAAAVGVPLPRLATESPIEREP